MPRKASSPQPVELDRGKAPFVALGVVLAGLLIVGGTILWAKSDTGQIDVSATIANSNFESARDGNGDNTPALEQATNEHSMMPNGGLAPQGGDVPRPPEPAPTSIEEATSTASTTDEEGGTAEEGGSTDTTDATDTTPDSTDTSPNTSTEPSRGGE